ncbi:MAG: Membrane-associated zinc metalloprotease [Candidatus Jorgensenbacteria bacterium GW2011_GWA1_48_11]|uniref:Zinc metalloprotease n=1 Tax=Candidatus Jorgensenbacteria bacterium GW2011_GWA1_48_11 TaxID=1618660 RepID=A0A0G1XA01_9BACT|nr:MAG: Membrane-associated zinc metalloprotease [Candidatus Jorgensenbacteria bacterium GW2011_GWA1_48_11]KKW11841.1 MAG: Membrane-associated zinc metalloprotease [Candidatus Jorgensenbacteria bacterium GW2011_GWB1_49_9]
MIIVLVIICLSILILIHELGHFLTAKFFGIEVEEFGIGFPPQLWSKKMGGTIYSVNALPFGGFVKIHGEDGESQGEKVQNSFSGKSFLEKSGVLLAGVFMNLVLGWLVLSFVLMAGAPEHLILTDVAPNSPAEAAGLQPGDIILRASFSNADLADPVKSGDLIDLVKSAGASPVNLKIGRSGEVLDVDIAGRVNPPEGQGSLGVALSEIGFKPTPFFESFWAGLKETWQIIVLVTAGFWSLLTKIFIEPKIVQTITGPVGIFGLAEQAGSVGLIYLFQLMALISINLAVLNLIPFPALDGGRFLMLIVEKLKGSPISRKIQIAVNLVGFSALILLMIVVTIQDVHKLIK